jgi:hypothetical protein
MLLVAMLEFDKLTGNPGKIAHGLAVGYRSWIPERN